MFTRPGGTRIKSDGCILRYVAVLFLLTSVLYTYRHYIGAPYYKLEGHGFESPMRSLIFFSSLPNFVLVALLAWG
jgi:hypothetical protein